MLDITAGAECVRNDCIYITLNVFIGWHRNDVLDVLT